MDRDSTEEVKLRVEISVKLRKGVYLVLTQQPFTFNSIQIKSKYNILISQFLKYKTSDFVLKEVHIFKGRPKSKL